MKIKSLLYKIHRYVWPKYFDSILPLRFVLVVISFQVLIRAWVDNVSLVEDLILDPAVQCSLDRYQPHSVDY